MLGCLKSCIRHPKERRNKARPAVPAEKRDTVAYASVGPACLSHGRDCRLSLSAGEHVALECAAPIVEEEASQIEEDIKAEETDEEIEEEPAIKVMGMTEESVVHAELASATIPKERKFQVVRVPGVFTRGRWKCWDYRDDVKPVEGLTFTDDKENDSAGTVTVTASTSVSTTSAEPAASNHSPLREESSTIVVTSIAPAPPTPQHGTPSSISEMPTPPYTITEHHPSTGGDWVTSSPTTVTITSSQPPQPAPPKDTVVVQSVAPPSTRSDSLVGVVPATPITPTPSMTSTFEVSPATAAAQQQQQSSQMTSSMSEQHQQPGADSCTSSHAMSASMTSSETGGAASIGGASSTSAASVGGGPSSVSPPSVTTTTTPSPEMTRSGSEAAPAAAQVEEEPAAAAPAISNAAAIDNKIEQAMDLVKTHLTFAVREEVEILRTTIAELESRVSTLETQNAYLKRHVSPEVLASLPGMVQQHKMSLPATAAPVHLQQSAATSAPSTTVSPSLAAAVQQEQQEAALHAAIVEAAAAAAASAAAPPRPAAAANKPYCPATTNFVNSLNTVVYPPNNPR